MHTKDSDGNVISLMDSFFAARPAGMAYLCEVPASLGAVTKLRMISGRVVADTTSGHTMIVPQQGPRGCG